MNQFASIKLILLFIGSAILISFSQKRDRVFIYLIGDSTMSEKSVSAYPETGWGMPFKDFFDSTVQVENHAKNGRSTKSFMEEGLWKPVVDRLTSNDWVFIQFGHNDEVPSKVGRYTTPAEFKENLRKYVTDARTKGANPVLITPVARRKFDEQGNLQDTHQEYSQLVREVAHSEGVPLIDLDRRSRQLLVQYGIEQSKLLYLHLNPNEHPNYPHGKKDNTHFNELGARIMAQLVLSEIRGLNLAIAEKVEWK